MELESLNNFVTNINKEFKTELKIDIWTSCDGRKKSKFILVKNNTIISPQLNYTQMNHFLLGVFKCKKLNL